MPERIQLRRIKGWRLPENAASVARPTKWGNPFVVSKVAGEPVWQVRLEGSAYGLHRTRHEALVHAVAAFGDAVRWGRAYAPDHSEVRRELRGKDLACWCKPTDPCHATILLAIANEEYQ